MKFYLLVIFVAIALYFTLRPTDVADKVETASNNGESEVLAVKENRISESKAGISTNSTQQSQETIAASSLLDSNEIMAKENMSSMLKQLAECTEIKNSVSSGPVDASVSSILDSVQSELGEPVIRSEDWNSIEVKLSDNSKRVIRLETVYEDDDIIKKLKYYHVTPTELTPIELNREQAVNPSDTFLASLEKEGDVVTREKSERVFFQNGEEISYTERNGQIQTSEIIRAGKSLKCGDYGQKSFRCQCF